MNHVRISVQAQAANRSRLPAAGQLLGIFVAAVLLVLPATATAQTPPAAPCRCASRVGQTIKSAYLRFDLSPIPSGSTILSAPRWFPL
jgi:hypothetical protein